MWEWDSVFGIQCVKVAAKTRRNDVYRIQVKLKFHTKQNVAQNFINICSFVFVYNIGHTVNCMFGWHSCHIEYIHTYTIYACIEYSFGIWERCCYSSLRACFIQSIHLFSIMIALATNIYTHAITYQWASKKLLFLFLLLRADFSLRWWKSCSTFNLIWVPRGGGTSVGSSDESSSSSVERNNRFMLIHTYVGELIIREPILILKKVKNFFGA